MIDAVFYSDQIIPANDRIDVRLLDLMRERGRQIGYVPSGPDSGLRFYAQRKAYYARLGLDLDTVHDPVDGSDATLETLFACDAIHLSGGHTARFLARLRHGGMLNKLRDWAARGGLLIGTSAGAIIMTPNIDVDKLFGDGRLEDAADAAALDLVPFEFFPHLQARPAYLPGLLAYSAGTSGPIIACPDGDGVVVSQGVVECIGEPLWLFAGEIVQPQKISIAPLQHR